MNNRSVETYLRKMIEIDQEALAVEGRIKEVEETKQKELRKIKRDMEMDILKRARMESRKEMESHVNEAKLVEAEVSEQTQVYLDRLRVVYAHAEDELVRSTVVALLDIGRI